MKNPQPLDLYFEPLNAQPAQPESVPQRIRYPNKSHKPLPNLTHDRIIQQAAQVEGIPPITAPSHVLQFCQHVRRSVKELKMDNEQQALDQVLENIAATCRQAAQDSIDRQLLFETMYDIPNDYILERLEATGRVIIGLPDAGIGRFCEEVKHYISRKLNMRHSGNAIVVPGIRRTAVGKNIGQQHVDEAVSVIASKQYSPSSHYSIIAKSDYEAAGGKMWADIRQLDEATLRTELEQCGFEHQWTTTDLIRLRKYLEKHPFITTDLIREDAELVANVRPTEKGAWKGQVPRQRIGGAKTKG